MYDDDADLKFWSICIHVPMWVYVFIMRMVNRYIIICIYGQDKFIHTQGYLYN